MKSTSDTHKDWLEFKLLCGIKQHLCDVEDLSELGAFDNIVYNSLLHTMFAQLRQDETYFQKKRNDTKRTKLA